MQQVLESTSSKAVDANNTTPIPLASNSNEQQIILPSSSTGNKTTQRDKKEKRRHKQQMRSGHAKTHAIVINLDDRNRFTEEVTV